MADVSQIESDRTLEDEGKWTTLNNGLDAEFRIAGTGSREFRRIKYEIAREVRLAEIEGLDAELECEARAAARLLKDWRNLTSKGEPFEFTAANALDLMRRCPALCGDVVEYCTNRFNYRRDYDVTRDGDAVGNSETPSPTA